MDCECFQSRYRKLLDASVLEVSDGGSEELYSHLDSCLFCQTWYTSIEPGERELTDKLCPGIESMLVCSAVRMSILGWKDAEPLEHVHFQHVQVCTYCQAVVIDAEAALHHASPERQWEDRIRYVHAKVTDLSQQKRNILLTLPVSQSAPILLM